MPQSFIKFYGNDWRSDPRLRLCEPVSRGIWIDLITIMMEADPIGHLLVNGKSPSAETIAALTVTPPKVIKRALADLEENGVYSKTDAGVIFSRRMVKDAAKAIEFSERGKRGGNPALVKPPVKPVVNLPLKPEDKHAGATRSQKPEALPPNPQANGRYVDKPEDVLFAFEVIREQQFGGPAATSDGKNPATGSYSPKDLSIAKGWLDSGIPFDPLRNLFEKKMADMAKRRAPPPSTVWFFHKSVDDAQASNWAGYDR